MTSHFSTSTIRGRGLSAITVASLLVSSNAAAAEAHVADPKQWCSDIAQLIAAKESDKALDAFVDDAIVQADKAVVAQQFSALAPLLAREGAFLYVDSLAEKYSGQSFARVWYLVMFENGPVFVRCELLKKGENWAVHGLRFHTEADGVDLPP